MNLNPAQLLCDLVRIPSLSGAEDQAADLVQSWCETYGGIDVERIGRSLFLRVGDSSGPRLMLNSHLDVVPPGEGWAKDPFDAAWRDGKLVARGANDAKASCVAMFCALALAKESKHLSGELCLALTAEEETTNAGMRDVLDAKGLPDAAVTGEPTGLEVVRAQSGLSVLIAEWTGVACHAAHVAHVDHRNAMHDAARAIAAEPSFWKLENEHEELGWSTISPTVLHAGERHNVVPDRAELTCDARLAPPYTGEDCRVFLEQRLAGAKVRIRSDRLRAVETDASHPLVRLALECSGHERAIGSRTLSDMALLQGIPAIKCGPGRTERSHTANEWVTEEELMKGVRFYSELAPRVLDALCAEKVVSS